MSKELFSVFKLKDPYLDYNRSYKRLEEEYNRYGSIVIAYDFDNTVYDFHHRGERYDDVIDLLRNLRENNCFLICFTSNNNLKFVRDYLESHNIPYDRINDNPPFFQCKSRKIYYNALLDDRAGLLEVYNQLATLMNKVNLTKQVDTKIKKLKKDESLIAS